MNGELLDIKDMAEYFGFSRETVRRKVLCGELPPPVIGSVGRRGTKRWSLLAVREFLHRRGEQAEATASKRI